MQNVRLVLVLLPLVVGYLVSRFILIVAGVYSWVAWAFLLLWVGFGLWISRSRVNRVLALAAGIGAPFLFLLLYLATAGTRASIYTQFYFVAVSPVVAQVSHLLGGAATAAAGMYLVAAVLIAAAFLIGFASGGRPSRRSGARPPLSRGCRAPSVRGPH